MFVTTTNAAEKKTILFFGDSLTFGYGVDSSAAYPTLIQKRIDGLGLPYRTINGGVSGDTTSAGIERLRWMLRQPPDVLFLALGANDGLRGIPPAAVQTNLEQMIDIAREKNPSIKIILAGMMMPANYGTEYTKRFSAIFPAIAKKKNVALVPFLLDKVAGINNLNLPDRIHPNAKGYEIVAETVWITLKPVLTPAPVSAQKTPTPRTSTEPQTK